MALARKAVADTVVRAPFEGVVEQAARLGRRLRHTRDEGGLGDAHQSAAGGAHRAASSSSPEVSAGRAVTMEVDAYPGETFTGQIRYVSPALKVDTAPSSWKRSSPTTPAA